jgi:hypothetical protein
MKARHTQREDRKSQGGRPAEATVAMLQIVSDQLAVSRTKASSESHAKVDPFDISAALFLNAAWPTELAICSRTGPLRRIGCCPH